MSSRGIDSLGIFLVTPQAFWRTPERPFRQVLCFPSTGQFRLSVCRGHEALLRNVHVIGMHFSVGDLSCGGCLQRFYGVKPCPKEMKCDVEVSFSATFTPNAISKLVFYHNVI